MPERLDKATRRREPVRAFLHYVEKLSKAKRRGANPRKIAKKKHVGYYADDEKAALAYNKAVSDAGLAGVRELNRVDASGRPVPKSRAAQFTVTIHGGRD